MKRSDSKLSVQSATGDKIFKIDDHIFVIASGMAADGDKLIDKMRIKGQAYTYALDSPIPMNELVEYIGSIKQSYTH